MSDYPPPPPPPGYGPIGYSPPAAYAPSPRPTVVTVLAIIGIIWSILGVLGALIGIASNTAMLMTGHGPFTQVPSARGHGMIGYTLGLTIINLPVMILLLCASIASLRLSGWGRRGMIWWSWAAILLTVISVAISYANRDSTMQAMQTQMQMQMLSNPAMTPQVQQQMQGIANMQKTFVSGALGVALFCPLLGLTFPIWILATFGKPRVRTAFGEQVG